MSLTPEQKENDRILDQVLDKLGLQFGPKNEQARVQAGKAAKALAKELYRGEKAAAKIITEGV